MEYKIFKYFYHIIIKWHNLSWKFQSFSKILKQISLSCHFILTSKLPCNLASNLVKWCKIPPSWYSLIMTLTHRQNNSPLASWNKNIISFAHCDNKIAKKVLFAAEFCFTCVHPCMLLSIICTLCCSHCLCLLCLFAVHPTSNFHNAVFFF